MDLVLQGPVERPRWPEVAAVVAVCTLVFVALVRLDGAASRGEAERARAALVERAESSSLQPTVTARRSDASLGNAGPISVPVGSAWSPGTSPSVGHAKPVSQAAGVEAPPLVLVLLAGVGVMMALAGSALLFRSR